MTIKPALIFALAVTVGAMINTTAMAADAVAGKITADGVCQTCHGMDGIGTNPMVANISGQQELYIVKQLEDYKSGKRQHEQMSIIVQMLDDEAIKNVAAWYAELKVTVEVPE